MKIFQVFEELLKFYGFQNWWPVHDGFDKVVEVSVGAVLTQNTSWSNVEKSLENLISANCLNFDCILNIDLETLKMLIKPSGFYNQKAKTLKDLAKLFVSDKDITREKLLSIKGIGYETADSILLYALDLPYFVIDSYTKRLFHRLGFIPEKISYNKLQDLITKNIPKDITTYKEFHALIVKHCKEVCTKKPKCDKCLLSCSFKMVV